MARIAEHRRRRSLLDSSPAYSTPTRSHMRATTGRLWLMNRMELLNSARSRAMRSSTSASTVASRPVVGSSRISSAGLVDSAMAMTTRCCMPPDSSCGKLRSTRSGLGDLHARQHLCERARARRAPSSLPPPRTPRPSGVRCAAMGLSALPGILVDHRRRSACASGAAPRRQRPADPVRRPRMRPRLTRPLRAR